MSAAFRNIEAGDKEILEGMLSKFRNDIPDARMSDLFECLSEYYLKRDEMPIFHSVILAGVYSVKNLKLKLRPESEHQYNSPWNIAAQFKIDMNFSADQIASMLGEYEADHHVGMDVQSVAEEIYQYTSSYPVLVSSICKCIDEDLSEGDVFKELSEAWSKKGVEDSDWK